MPEPNIARRCRSCGASIRDRAYFCPQCGQALTTPKESTASPKSDQAQPSTTTVTAPLNDPSQQKTKLDTKPESNQPAKPDVPVPRPAADLGRSKPAEARPVSNVLAGARDKVQRATGVARNVGGDVVQRGQKLREISNVVRDEAAYDPSLRFVLVAAVLFVLFLIIVLLNRFIT